MTLLKNKQTAIEEIIQLKKKQIAKINDKQIEKLDEDDLIEIDLETIQELKEKVKVIMKENVDNKNIRQFKKSDHIYRRMREEENKLIEKNINSQELNVKSIIENIKEEHCRVIQLKH